MEISKSTHSVYIDGQLKAFIDQDMLMILKKSKRFSMKITGYKILLSPKN